MFQDVQLVWDNCRSFNKPDSDICKTCDEAQQAFLARWQQQGLLPPAADKKKKGRQPGPAIEAAAAGKDGKKSDFKQEQDTTRQRGKLEGKVAKQREATASDKPRPVAQETAAVGKLAAKRKRGLESADVEEEEPSSSAAAQAKKASKAAVVKVDLAPEKMSAGARLRKGLPPTPPSRISPRMATAEAASNAAASDSVPDEAPKAQAKGKSKPAASQGANKAKMDSDPPVARRSSGRLK